MNASTEAAASTGHRSSATRWIRAGVGLLLLVDVMLALRGLLAWAPPPGFVGTNWLEWIAGSRPLLGGFTLIALWSLLRFARGRFELVTGSIGAVAAILLFATHGRALGPDESLALVGVLGWLLGSAAERIGRRTSSAPGIAASWTMGSAVLAVMFLGFISALATAPGQMLDASWWAGFPWPTDAESVQPWTLPIAAVLAVGGLLASRRDVEARTPLTVAAVLLAAAAWSPNWLQG